MSGGRFTIPTRVFLNTAQRQKLETLVREHDVDVPELLTELLVSFLEHLPEYESERQQEPAPADDEEAALQQRRAELRRLRARVVAAGGAAPDWLTSYVTDLEREVTRLEER